MQFSKAAPAELWSTDIDDATYRQIIESVPDYAIFLLDPQGHVRTWTHGAERIKGYRADEIIGRHFSVFYPHEKRDERWPEHVLAVARASGRVEDEGWRLRKDGTRFWANVVITRIDGPDGEVRGFAKITRDMTLRREQEELLRHSEEKFRLLVEGVRDYAVFMLDPRGYVSSWNSGAQRIKGYRADEIIGKHFSVFYPPDVVASGWPERELELALADGRFEDEGWRVRRDGSRFWASVVITALHDRNGRHVGFAKVTRDLTERRRVRALEDEGRRLTTFLAMLGHELRNPLAPIANAVSIMQLQPIESDTVRRCRDVIARQLGQMTRLVDDLLDVGRITSGKIHLDIRTFDLGLVLAEALEAVEQEARKRGHGLHLQIADGPAWVRGDRTRLLQVFGNLLHNAVKFTQRGGEITATLHRTDAHVEVAVRDNGPGIPPHRIADIFNLFVQGEQDSARTEGGLGLGLSLVQQLVTLHGGEVSVFSTGQPGKGAEFVVRLPIAPEGRAAPQPELPTAPAQSRRILVVDDNRDAADTLDALLHQLGYRSYTAYDGATALDMARKLQLDAVFLDLGLPDMDGFEIVRRLRAELPEPPPFIALTGYGHAEIEQSAREAGFLDHLTKPLAAADLEAVLARLFA